MEYQSTSQNDGRQRLGRTLRADFARKSFWRDLKREWRELSDFAFSPDERAQLASMGSLHRWFATGWRILKRMVLRLPPFRRLLLVVGLAFLFVGRVTVSEGDQNATVSFLPFGALIVLFLLFLELKDKLLARSELEAGRAVQRTLLPERSTAFPGWSLWLFTSAANEVGGDLVDYIRLDDARAGLVLADVAGKGLKAALFMSKLHTIVHTCAPEAASPAAAVTAVNRAFHRDSPAEMFASMLYLELRAHGGEARMVNAGHPPPLLVHGRAVQELSKGERALGLGPETVYTETAVTLEPGDCLVVYSDGVSEACNEQREFFGLERLRKLLSSAPASSAPALGEAIVAEIERFIGDARPHDDLSIIVIQREQRPEGT